MLATEFPVACGDMWGFESAGSSGSCGLRPLISERPVFLSADAICTICWRLRGSLKVSRMGVLPREPGTDVLRLCLLFTGVHKSSQMPAHFSLDSDRL